MAILRKIITGTIIGTGVLALLRKHKMEKWPKVINENQCPRCGLDWDGRRCSHCNYPKEKKPII